jgi:hypothetical protein
MVRILFLCRRSRACKTSWCIAVERRTSTVRPRCLEKRCQHSAIFRSYLGLRFLMRLMDQWRQNLSSLNSLPSSPTHERTHSWATSLPMSQPLQHLCVNCICVTITTPVYGVSPVIVRMYRETMFQSVGCRSVAMLSSPCPPHPRCIRRRRH